MKTKHIFIVFILVALVQLIVPAQMILNKESVIKQGVAYKFKTQPVDPNDPFRGKYIVLNFDIRSFKTSDSLWTRNDPVYVYLKTDSLGFATIDNVSKVELESSKKDFFIAKVDHYSSYTDKVHIDLPFNRYYMEETKAYKAEVAVRDAQRDTLPNNTYALVYVKAGETVLNDVVINEISIKDYVEEANDE
ncbi:GDYXXLXY domain-containing protein [uncultured Algibacter sp.]|uniref:GDYXXLXY domain-containing protein n=1 Tax=uncultured Algibacter sp. TaxID=298659 RepID=UPI003216AEE2